MSESVFTVLWWLGALWAWFLGAVLSAAAINRYWRPRWERQAVEAAQQAIQAQYDRANRRTLRSLRERPIRALPYATSGDVPGETSLSTERYLRVVR